MFRIPSAAALGLCRLCGSVIGSIWKPTASPALPVGGSVRGSRTHGAFPAPRPACLKAHLSLGSRPTYITVFFCVNSFRNPPVSLFSPGSESMGTEHQGRQVIHSYTWHLCFYNHSLRQNSWNIQNLREIFHRKSFLSHIQFFKLKSNDLLVKPKACKS